LAQSARWTLAWRDRPREEAVHFNPAFCGELVARTIREYHRLARAPLSLPLAFVVLPLTLHPPTRHALPRRANTTFGSWSAEHHVILSEMPDRVLRLRPVTREALLFLTQISAVAIRDGGIVPGERPLRSSAASLLSTVETDETRRAAGLLGRWFAHQATAATVLQTMGVTL
jgi:hypothetical protein